MAHELRTRRAIGGYEPVQVASIVFEPIPATGLIGRTVTAPIGNDEVQMRGQPVDHWPPGHFARTDPVQEEDRWTRAIFGDIEHELADIDAVDVRRRIWL